MSDTAYADFTEQVLSLSYEQTIILMEKMLESLKKNGMKKIMPKWKMILPEVQ